MTRIVQTTGGAYYIFEQDILYSLKVCGYVWYGGAFVWRNCFQQKETEDYKFELEHGRQFPEDFEV